jgi:hypothetical protein
MHPKRMLRMTGVVIIASLSSAAAAQTATLTGAVVNIETKKPLADVVVTATSPALQGEQVVVTDLEGQYRIPELPPGTYTLRFDKEAFKPYWRSEIHLRSDRSVRVNVMLLPEAYTETINVLYCGPLVDVTSSTTGLSLEQEHIRRLAVNRPTGRGGAARSFEGLVELTPGVEFTPYGVAIHGATPFENALVVDGLSIQDPVSGINPLPLNVEFLQDLSVHTAGLLPEHGRATGGILQAWTWSGSNELHGSVFGNWVPGTLGGTPTPVSNPSGTLSSRNVLKNQGDVGATLGGPLLKDRLWFFAGVVPSSTRVEHTRTLQALGEPLPGAGTSRTFFADERGLQALGKLTYLITEDHSVSLSAITTPTRSGGLDRLTVDPETGAVREAINGQPGSVLSRELENNLTTSALAYKGMFLNKKLVVDANLGWSRWTASSVPLVDDGTASSDLSTTLEAVDRSQGNVQATYALDLAGHHTIRAGLDTDRPTSTWTRSTQGGVVLQEPPSSAPPPVISQTYKYTTQFLGGFVQDSWTLPLPIWVTVNAGLRYDTQWLYTDTGELAFALAHQLSPRVGLVVDPTKESSMRLFAHYAKYPGQLPLGLMRQAFPQYTPPPGTRPSPIYSPSPPTHDPQVDPGLVAPSSSEVVAGVELLVPWRSRLNASYTHRRLDSVIDELSDDAGNTWFLGNPGSGIASEFPKARRTYDAVTVALSRDYAWDWLLQASYTWSRLRGNYTTAILGGFDLLSRADNVSSGLLPEDRTHSLKLHGAKAFRFTRDLSANLGLSYRGRSGTPLNYLGGDPLFGPGEIFVLPRGSSGERTPWVHTVDSNVGLTWRFDRSKAVSLTVDVFNLFNFQAATRVDQNYTYASVLPVTEPVAPGTLTPDKVTRLTGFLSEKEPLRAEDLNPNFKKPLQYQAPRQVRLGLRYSF